MAATTTANAVADRHDADRAFASEGCSAARPWGNGPGDAYDWHTHGYHKVLFCLDGSITFHLRERDVTLQAGDRLDIEPGTEHAATVGAQGCACVEATRGASG
jgi:mannose-6-phosphate isomerase-like protein (cupin superfamily)